MKTKATESFSAFLDGEASELDIQRMLKALDEQPELYSQWHDLSKTQALAQGDVLVDTSIERVPNIAHETDVIQPKRGFILRIKQGGIAAAVAISVVGVTAFINVDSSAVQSPIATVVTPNTDGARLAQQQFEAQQRLDMYLREHAEQASFTTGHVVAPTELEWLWADTE